MTPMPIPSPFISSAGVAERLPAEALPSVVSGHEHPAEGSRFSIDEDAFIYAVDPPPLPPLFISDPSPEYVAAAEIEPLLKTLFHRS